MDEAQLDRTACASKASQYRDALHATLACTPEVRLLRSVWAARAIQTNAAGTEIQILREIPPEARTSDITSKFAIYPWELETLVNERLGLPFEGLFQEVIPEDWNQIAALTNLIRNLENNEYVMYSRPEDVIDHIFKLGSRQFEWQQGFMSKQEIFRSIFVYGQGACADYFEKIHGISIDDFTATCFAFLSMYFSSPAARRDTDLSIIGVNDQARDIALRIVSAHIREVKERAKSERAIEGETAFKASVLRQFPIIAVSAASSILVCPLPELLLNRMTFGVFYDVINGGGSIRAEIGTNFEKYALMAFSRFLCDCEAEGEFSYASKMGQRKSSDLLLTYKGETHVLIECKATRLSASARYADFDENARGYQDMIKGVTQVWRFVSDIRRGVCSRKLHKNVVGAILTLDSWFVAAPKRQEAVVEKAKEECRKRYFEVIESDMIPICFVWMPELERALATKQTEKILDNFQSISRGEKMGYSFDISLQEQHSDNLEYAPFPFDEELMELLPWWRRISNLRDN